FLQASAILGRKLMPYALEGHTLGIMLPTSNAAVVTLFAVMSAGRVPALINFTAGAAHSLPPCRPPPIRTHLTPPPFFPPGSVGKPGFPSGDASPHRLSGGCHQDDRDCGQAARFLRLEKTACAAQTRRLGSGVVHVRLGGFAKRCRPLPSQYAG